ncbi:hypothetical protein [Arthrobacter sp.]|uniref:hypothetical protein n=1 Tax=Arthrobacter sp. TaxID=1667 RepID=UPI003A93FC6B
MRAFARAFYSWKAILFTTSVGLAFLIATIYEVGIRSYSIPIGFAVAILHFVLSGWLWRDYVYGDADFDSNDSYAPAGLTTSM